MNIAVINGPNLNLVGVREPDIYGDVSFDEYIPQLRLMYPDHKITYYQSNHEGAIIDEIHRNGFDLDGIILNAGGLTHTSICLADAVRSVPAIVVEVHLTDIHQREHFRKHSYITAAAQHTIIGQGMDGYRMAIDYLIKTNV